MKTLNPNRRVFRSTHEQHAINKANTAINDLCEKKKQWWSILSISTYYSKWFCRSYTEVIIKREDV